MKIKYTMLIFATIPFIFVVGLYIYNLYFMGFEELNAFYILLIFMVLLFFEAIIAIRIISKPLTELNQVIEDITKGNLDVQIDKKLSNRNDEIGSLTRSLQRILSSMKLAILRTEATKEQIGLGEAIKAKKRAESERDKALRELEKKNKELENKIIELDKLKTERGEKFKKAFYDLSDDENNLNQIEKTTNKEVNIDKEKLKGGKKIFKKISKEDETNKSKASFDG